MGNIHIFIADELHERLRKVCRHKVTQQKFLEEGIEKLVSEKESVRVVKIPDNLKPFVPSQKLVEMGRELDAIEGVECSALAIDEAGDGLLEEGEEKTVFLDGFTPYEKVKEDTVMGINTANIQIPSKATIDSWYEGDKKENEDGTELPTYYVPDTKEGE